jgi:feruloyl-CoA synthase
MASPNLHACRQISATRCEFKDVVRHSEAIACLKRGLEAHNASPPAAACGRARHAWVEPPSIDCNELTDKGYINQRVGRARRGALVERIMPIHPANVIILN